MDIVKDSVELEITSHELTQKTNEIVVSADTALEISGLKKEYASGALLGYRHLYEMATESEDEIEAKLSKIVLKSFAGQSLALNWSEIGEYPDLLEEVGQILASFQSVGFVPPSALNDEEINNLISQEDLI